MTDTYNEIYKTISWGLTSKKKKRHALLERKKNKDDIIP